MRRCVHGADRGLPDEHRPDDGTHWVLSGLRLGSEQARVGAPDQQGKAGPGAITFPTSGIYAIELDKALPNVAPITPPITTPNEILEGMMEILNMLQPIVDILLKVIIGFTMLSFAVASIIVLAIWLFTDWIEYINSDYFREWQRQNPNS